MKTVLIIEDNEDNLALITQLLESTHNYRILSAMSGKEGIEKALSDTPDFILLDVQLPDIDGTEVLKEIRSEKAGSKVPIIAVTSYAMAGDRERLLNQGCDGYIEKPIDPMLFVSQIEKVINGVHQ